mgnify:FL=1
MRNLIFILLILFVPVGCDLSNKKPDNLIVKEQMENIIFDILILNAINTNSLMSKMEVIGDEFIFDRYSVDSIQFYESEIYYSKRPRDHFEIYSNVKRRILKTMDSISNN